MNILRPRLVPFVLALIAAVALVGCDSTGSSTSNNGEVTVSFATTSSTQSTSSLAKTAADSLVLSGSNGTM